jgi:uncharacterized membrane protein (DUF4010 family)
MATNGQKSVGIGLMGFAFAMVGLIFVFAEMGVLGTTMAVAGLFIFAAGLWNARKPATNDKAEAAPEANRVPAEPARTR